MEWQGGRESENVEDQRSFPTRGIAVGGGLGALILALVVFFLGGDPRALLNPGADQPAPNGAPEAGQEDELKHFVRVVLADTEDVWHDEFRKMGKTYREPHLVLFSGHVRSACGFADAAVGPFYCPGDERVYLDLSFFDDLKRRYHAPGEFAQAYVIAHEIGHHVQNLLGISGKVDAQRGRVSK
jgi:predicted metalloprotease